MREYDEYGFYNNWIHKDTGTRWDTLGFNKNGTIHKDTNTSKDKFGLKREDYNRLGSCSYFNIILRKLFVNTTDLKFNGEKFNGEKNLDPVIDYENISKIELNSFRPSKTISSYHDTRPRKLDGSPDYRYKSSLKFLPARQTTASYIIVYHIKEPSKKIFINYTGSRDLSRNIFEKFLKKYNRFFSALENNIEFKNLYKDFLFIQKKCLTCKKDIDKLKFQKQEKTDIYNKLYVHQEKFTEDQQKQFENLKQEIESIDSKIKQEIIDFKKDFDNIYEKLEAELEVEKNYQKKVEENINSSKVNDEINNLFSQIK